MTRSRPENWFDLLQEVVESARQTRFWRDRLGGGQMLSLDDFEALPVTGVWDYRSQEFAEVVSDVDSVEWIPGAWLGQSVERVPVAEGPEEARVRVELMEDALRPVVEGASNPSALVLATNERRHFGAEMCAVLVRMGVPAHLLVDSETDRLDELVRAFDPDVLALLSPALDHEGLSNVCDRLVTVGCDLDIGVRNHVDLYVQNELGVLGSRSGAVQHTMNHHRFHFESSQHGTLVVTPYFYRVQPIVRLDTGLSATVVH